MNGNRVFCNISMYNTASMMPSNMQTLVGPRMLTPAQMCIFKGYFGLNNKKI